MRIHSPAFEHDGRIPVVHTCDDEDLSPDLLIEDVPGGAESLALIVDDPDAPMGTFVHWLIWNMPATTEELPEGLPTTVEVPLLESAVQGTNDFDEIGYRGPCPPHGHGDHHYHFTVYALDAMLDLEAGATRQDLDLAMSEHVIESAELVGLYARD